MLPDIAFDQSDEDKAVLARHTALIEVPNCYMEIGTHEGATAWYARQNVSLGVEVYTVDILDNIKIREGVHFIHKASEDAAMEWDKPIGLLFIDADHNKAFEDFMLWSPFVVENGYILFHDYAFHSPNVIRDCNRIIEDPGYRKIEHPEEPNSSIFIIQKCSNHTK